MIWPFRTKQITPRPDIQPYELPNECMNPFCNHRARDNHHIAGRKGELREAYWVELDGELVPVRGPICGNCHPGITGDLGGHKFSLRWDTDFGTYVWTDLRTGQSAPISPELPRPVEASPAPGAPVDSNPGSLEQMSGGAATGAGPHEETVSAFPPPPRASTGAAQSSPDTPSLTEGARRSPVGSGDEPLPASGPSERDAGGLVVPAAPSVSEACPTCGRKKRAKKENPDELTGVFESEAPPRTQFNTAVPKKELPAGGYALQHLFEEAARIQGYTAKTPTYYVLFGALHFLADHEDLYVRERDAA